MESRAKAFGHPIHQMLITFPIGSLGFAVASDALHSVLGERRHADAALSAIDFGLATAALAAPFGAIDWLAIAPRTRAKRVGAWHAVGNLAMLGLFGASRWLRTRRDPAPNTAKWLAGAGFALSGITAWLGGELVTRHGIGVHDRLGEDAAPSFRLRGGSPESRPQDSREAPSLAGFF